jgi:hypothetical protein
MSERIDSLNNDNANKLELQKTEYEIKMIELEQRFGSASEEQSAALSNQ